MAIFFKKMADTVSQILSVGNSPGNMHFHQVIALHEETHLDWEALAPRVPFLPRGWFELSKLSSEDRIEFKHAYWYSTLPLGIFNFESRIDAFFASVEEIGIFLTQLKEGLPFEVHMVYSLKGEKGFFHGYPPANPQSLLNLKSQFAAIQLPVDYLAFLQIHDGFGKYMDTGLIRIKQMSRCFLHLQQFLKEENLTGPDGKAIRADSLIPFYESSLLHSYQCFYSGWFPEIDMGNVFFSEDNQTISNFLDNQHLEENLAFPTFLHWLFFYLEDRGPRIES